MVLHGVNHATGVTSNDLKTTSNDFQLVAFCSIQESEHQFLVKPRGITKQPVTNHQTASAMLLSSPLPGTSSVFLRRKSFRWRGSWPTACPEEKKVGISRGTCWTRESEVVGIIVSGWCRYILYINIFVIYIYIFICVYIFVRYIYMYIFVIYIVLFYIYINMLLLYIFKY